MALSYTHHQIKPSSFSWPLKRWISQKHLCEICIMRMDLLIMRLLCHCQFRWCIITTITFEGEKCLIVNKIMSIWNKKLKGSKTSFSFYIQRIILYFIFLVKYDIDIFLSSKHTYPSTSIRLTLFWVPNIAILYYTRP